MSKEYFDVPKGNIYAEDEGEILQPLDIIPKRANPANLRPEPSEVVEIYPGENPFDVVEKMAENGNVWIILHEDVLEEARRIPNKFHCVTPVLGEIFTFPIQYFRNPKVIYLNRIKGFNSWKIVQAWKSGDATEFIKTPVNPERIITVMMKG